MSAPNDGYGQYPPQEFDQSAAYAEYAELGHEDSASAAPQASAQHGADHRRKKRAYAPGQFEVAAGGNAAVGGQLPGGGQFGAPQPAPTTYGNFPAQDPQTASYGQQYGMGQPAAGPAPGGYQAPEQYYSSATPMAPGPGQTGVAGITSGMGSMALGGGVPPGAQAIPARPGPLNQLYPTDLLNQPFNVSELDLPPPPIILPPNVSVMTPAAFDSMSANRRDSRALLRLPMPTVRRNTSGLP